MKAFLVALGAFALGVVLSVLLLGRYQFQNLGDACLVRVDRLTGKASYWRVDTVQWRSVEESP